MIRVLKLQRVGLINPTVVEYKGKVLATNQLDIESTCNLWRCHFGFYPTEKIDLAMTKKEFSVIQQKTLSSVKSVYDLFYEYNFIPRVFDSNEEVSEWNMYRTNEVEKLKSENTALCKEADENAALSMENKMRADRLETENAALREQISKMIMPPCTLGDTLYITSFCFGDGYDEAGNATHTCGWQISEAKVDEKNFYKMCDLVRNGKAFFSREAAEACLAELKGGKER